MHVVEHLRSKCNEIEELCRKYAVKRLRLFGPPVGINAFDQFMGLLLDLEALLGRKVDVVDWNAARNPFFKRHAERSVKDVYAA